MCSDQLCSFLSSRLAGPLVHLGSKKAALVADESRMEVVVAGYERLRLMHATMI